MASTDYGGGGFYRNFVQNFENYREQCHNDILKSTSNFTDTSDASNIEDKNNASQSSTNEFESSVILNEIVAKNTKTTRGRKPKQVAKKQKSEVAFETLEFEECNVTKKKTNRGGKRGPNKHKTNTSEIINLSSEDLTGEIGNDATANKTKKGRKAKNSPTTVLESFDCDIETCGIQTRTSKRLRVSPNSTNMPTVFSQTDLNVSINNDEFMQNRRGKSQSRGRGRSTGRRRGVRARGIPQISTNHMYPTFSVGNTEEYDDISENIPLFSQQDYTALDNAIVIDDPEPTVDNEELSVKVIWQSLDVHRFTIRKHQKLSQIFKTFAEKEKICMDKLLFTYNDKVIKHDNTPQSIGYNIAKFIEGGVVSQSISNLFDNTDGNATGIQIKFQCQNIKKPVEISIEKIEKLSVAMMKCAEQLKLPLSKLKFAFDGDSVAGTNTPEQLGLESGDCIDVKIIK